ncbi:response regulator [Paenibacillus cymbidii]|uniref:response regulator n=1 Tax=Paenibacillus cymbidii TaxID=1639034 RepID=UPI001081AD09|nr:response regulator [Paenibacillus cymbidii]
MKAIIVDDELMAIKLLQRLLDLDGRIEVAGTFVNPLDAIAAVAELQPEVAFLDIQMPLMNGLELAERVKDANEETEIIFVSAYDQFAFRAIKANAVDYLLKPVDIQELRKTITRLYKRKRLPTAPTFVNEKPNTLTGFGGFLLVGSDPADGYVSWRTGKAQELMAYLFLKRGQEISKWEIIDALWPDCSEVQSFSNLHTTIYQVRKTLKSYAVAAGISYRHSHYRFEAEDLASDVAQFASLAFAETPITAANAEMYEQCLGLYKGDLFGSWSYPWCLQTREMYRQRFAALAKRLGVYFLGSGDRGKAMQHIRQLIDMQPLDEEAYEMAMRIDLDMKNQAAFIARYRQLERVLHAELGIQPDERIRKLFERGLREGRI